MSRRKTTNAVAWSAVDMISRQLVQFAVTLVLARLVAPADFGTIAIVLFFSAFGTSVLSGAVLVAITRGAGADGRELSVLFWWLLGASAILSALLVLISPWLARFYHLPDLVPLGWLAAGQVMATAVAIVPAGILTRALKFRTLALVGVVSNISAGVVGIVMALNGYGVFSLGVQVLLSALVPAIAIWPLVDWRPSLHVRPAEAAKTLGIVGWLVPTNVLNISAAQGYSVIVGRVEGATELGLYGRAANLAQIPQNIFMQIVGRVALPLFAARADDREELASGLLESVRISMVAYVPIMAGLAACASTIVPVLFGARWIAAAPLLAVLAVAGMLFPLKVLNLNLLLATGRADRCFAVEMSEKGVAVACTLAGSFLGLAALAWSQVIAAAIGLFVVGRASRAAIGVGLGRQLVEVRSILAAGAVMGLAANRLDALLTLPAGPRLALVVVASAIVYGTALLVLRVPAFDDLKALAAGLRAPPPLPKS